MTKNAKISTLLKNLQVITNTPGRFKSLTITEITLTECPAEPKQLQQEHMTERARISHRGIVWRNALIVVLLLGVFGMGAASTRFDHVPWWFGLALVACIAGAFGYRRLRIKTPLGEARLSNVTEMPPLLTRELPASLATQTIERAAITHRRKSPQKKRSRRSSRRR